MIPWDLIYTGVFLLAGVYTFKKFLEFQKAKVSQETKQLAIKGQATMNPLARYNSFSDLLCSLAQGADMSAQQIAAECKKKGVDPMKDIGYNTQVKNVQRFSDMAEKFQKNQIFTIADNLLFPIARDVYPKIPKMLSGFIKELS